MVRQTGDTEACENTEGEVEAADKDEGGKAHGTGRDAEVGDNPEGSGSERWSDAEDKCVETGCVEAVKKKVSRDQIVGPNWPEGEGVDMVSLEPGSGIEGSGIAALAEQAKHRGAAIDGVGMKLGSGGQQFSEKTSVSVAKDKSLLLIEEMEKEAPAAAFEAAAEGEVFEPAIRASYEVEVGARLHRKRNGVKRMGASSARSAAARRVRAEMRWRR